MQRRAKLDVLALRAGSTNMADAHAKLRPELSRMPKPSAGHRLAVDELIAFFPTFLRDWGIND